MPRLVLLVFMLRQPQLALSFDQTPFTISDGVFALIPLMDLRQYTFPMHLPLQFRKTAYSVLDDGVTARADVRQLDTKTIMAYMSPVAQMQPSGEMCSMTRTADILSMSMVVQRQT